MKSFQLILILFILTLLFNSCGKDFGDLNVDPNNPSKVPAEVLITSAQKSIAQNVFTALDAVGFTGLSFPEFLSQSWTQNNYTNICRYEIPAGLMDPFFVTFYAGILEDLSDVQKAVRKCPGLDPVADSNKIAIAKILQAYSFQLLTDVVGPIPYREALAGDQNRTPEYESQKDVYLGIINDLEAAIGMLNESSGSFGSADIIYSGEVSKWNLFGNALLLRIAMRMSDVEPDKAKVVFEKAFQGSIKTNIENACFKFLSATPNSNPLHQQRIERGNADLGLSNILIDRTLKPLNDPRLFVWADERENGGGYFGRPYGQEDGVAARDYPENYSQPSGAFIANNRLSTYQLFDILRPDASACLLSYAEICFLAAEAIERNWNIPGTAADWYHNGIKASFEEWGITDEKIWQDYIAQQDVNYNLAPGDWKQKIGVQKWLALFMQGYQAWIEWRRLDFQKLELPVDGPLADIGNQVAPMRLVYPLDEQNLNAANYNNALKLLGGPDKLSTRVWWDIK